MLPDDFWDQFAPDDGPHTLPLWMVADVLFAFVVPTLAVLVLALWDWARGRD